MITLKLISMFVRKDLVFNTKKVFPTFTDDKQVDMLPFSKNDTIR
ncbi:hypothetical protein HMPREF1545_00345 [Oscillibacter sp. KLE 1728]|nr:hypothetical protein HMPREF1545_00345 [Oscillibacter sp. KLE 1728]ERK67136.1 hypothetical protein HMPREF1546_00643 [Oscillibacter sp. KLE 1745]